ncbi:NACHT domain-containing protein [Myxacorys almedinensis A]|uniref:NACHT domain-containing protein n=2 Tax=Myxacorys TaxID=2056239 RepID=A0A8J7Z337_9CYAN|nr:NACHT domain-containing protein [Myxacorys almedinensis A]
MMTINEALGVLDSILGQGQLTDLQETVFRLACDGQTYEQMATAKGYDPDYVKLVGSQLWQTLSEHVGQRVTKSNFRVVLRQWASEQSAHGDRDRSKLAIHPPFDLNPATCPFPQCDWGEAIDVSSFCGRAQELAELQQWITHDRARLVAILGMGGIGKTALSVKLATALQPQFEQIIWRSLRDAPPIAAILADLIQFLSKQHETELPETTDGKLGRLMHYLRSSRCLLILDNAESILGSGEQTGYYPSGYEAYGSLFRRIGETMHQSCLVITSREKPREVAALEGEAIRSLRLAGLAAPDVHELLKPKSLMATQQTFVDLTHLYTGNPLALKIAAATIQELFDGDVAEFLNQETAVFGDISKLLDEQFDRLSDLEKQMMYWIAINRTGVSLAELADDIVPPVPKRQLFEALASLARRPLVEKHGARFTQQPVVMEYAIDKLITCIHREIVTGKFHLFMSHALMKASVEDYVRESQIRMIVQPLLDRLTAASHCHSDFEEKLREVLRSLRQEFGCTPGYGAGNVLNLLRYAGSDLTGYDFSELAVWQAHLQGATLHHVNFTNASLEKSLFSDTLGNVWSVAYSPDGTILAASDTSGEVHLWRVADGQKLATLKGHQHWVCEISFSADGKTLASVSADTIVNLWDVATGRCRHTLRGHLDWVVSVAYSPTQAIVASSSADRTIRIWDAQTGECLRILSGHHHWICAIAFSPDGHTLISGSDDRTVKQWDVATGTCLQTFKGHTSAVRGVAVHPSGHAIASASEDETVRLWNLTTQAVTTLAGHVAEVRGIQFSPDGQLLASASYDETVKLWDVQTERCIKTLHEHRAPVRSVAFSPCGQWLASGSADQSVRVWSRSGDCRKTLQGYTNFVLSVAFSPTTALLASTSTDHTVNLWDTVSGRCLKTLRGHTNWVWSVAFSVDGQQLASASLDHTISLWILDADDRSRVLRGHTNWVWSVAFSPDGQTLASGSFDQTIRLWNPASGECRRIIIAQSRIWSIAYSPNGALLASGEEDCTIQLWNPLTGQCLQTLKDHDRRVVAIAFSPDGKTLVSASEDYTLKLWDVKTGRCLKTLNDHDRLAAVAFCADGRTIISSGIEPTIKLWDGQTGAHQVLEGHRDRVWSVACSADGRLVASGSEDETIRLWDRQTGECLQVLQKPRPYDGMMISGIEGITEAQKITLTALGAISTPD